MAEVGHDVGACDAAIVAAFQLLGKRWNGVIVAVLAASPGGFGALRRALPGISDSMLSDRLAELAAAGLIERAVSSGPPVAVTYALAPAGRALVPALDQLGDWARTNLTAH